MRSGYTRFPHLLSPLRVGTHLLRNRVVMGSMHTRLEHLDNAVRRQTAYYAARAAGGVALIITGGYSPNEAGLLESGGPILVNTTQAEALRTIVDAVHEHGAKILLQILHAGRYARHDAIVGVSVHPSPISRHRFTPRLMSTKDVESTLNDFVRCAELARYAGFDGVELMGSEGYLINQFTASRTNDRTDAWGGSLENRCRFPVEVTRRIRQQLGSEFMIMYRISAIDLVEGGATGEEIDYLARAVEAAGADILNTGYGWHESPVPTIAYPVPRAGWAFAAARLKGAVSIPVMASNRINTPDVAESLLTMNQADCISMARPMLADPEFVIKAAEGRGNEINTCIACNQSCLDHIFTARTATCLVNPRACHEIEFESGLAAAQKRIAVIGAGPAGLSCAIEAARRGHSVTLYEADDRLGGQLNLALRVPGKTEFAELLRYFARQIELAGIEVKLGQRTISQQLLDAGYDHVVVATGIIPRIPQINGIGHAKVVSYVDVLEGRVDVGQRVAIIGAGGIAHDVAEFLSADAVSPAPEEFYREWGVDVTIRTPGGCMPPQKLRHFREITIFQRSMVPIGSRLGKSTGWIVRNRLHHRGVRSIAGVTYLRIDDRGLYFRADGHDEVAEVDMVVICAGQEPNDRLAQDLRAEGLSCDLIGGARLAGELDAARAIDEGTRLAYQF